MIDRKPEKQYKRHEPVTPSFGISDKQPDNSKPDNQPQDPDYDEPQQPVKIDERLFDELDKHSYELNKYLDGI